MENTNKRYWRGLEELRNDEKFVKEARSEFSDGPTESQYESLVDGAGTHRRDFLKVLGFGMAAVSLAACEAPVKKAIPYVNKPEGEFPTIANWYASTYAEGGDYASILVKTREGRPVKIEPNSLSKTSYGVSARVHASLLGLYDNEKLKGPKKGDDTKVSWDTVDKEIVDQLGRIAAQGGAIRILSSTILSPSTKSVIADFTTKYPTTSHVMYDANSSSAILKGNELSFGKAVFPSYDFSKAKVIVGIDADFLGTWISPDTFSAQFAETRRLGSDKEGKKEMSRHYQFESILSVTGSNADYRTAVKPSQLGLVAASLYNKVAAKLGGSPISAAAIEVPNLDKAATELVAAKGQSLVVSGINDASVQVVINALNSLLGSYGTTINLDKPANYRQGNDVAMNGLIDDVKGGKVAALILFGANPVYDHPRGAELAAALPRVGLSVSFNDRADETSSLLKYICPAPHYLESWNDAEPVAGSYSLAQPAISMIFSTRQAQASLLKWAGLASDYHEYIKAYWRKSVYTQGGTGDFEQFWIKSLHDGVYDAPATLAASGATFAGNLSAAASGIAKKYKASSTGIELALFENIGLGNGFAANNPWLQELPEPITKACWDNHACISQKTAAELGFEQGDVVKVDIKGKAVEVPVIIQPGLANGTVAIAIGFGREKAGKSANGVGKNVYPLAAFADGYLTFAPGEAIVSKTGETREIAQTQTHNTVMNRKSVLQETVLAHFQKDPMAGRFVPKIPTSDGVVDATDLSLWNGHKYKNHSWGMVIDLNTCFGCGSCVISCQAENNIPVVGRQEVINSREMHWLRIDRYYSSDADVEDLRGLEIASENPEVTFQPMLCQHCNNAPCETVCPVLATTHSSEGLNQMTYNRCVGTRYCANNCPYKVRRFNWFKYFDNDNFDYHFNNDLGKMVINPDVTVRSRGVIEKCSMCVHRIQDAKLTAKKERRRIVDGEVNVACASSCPTNAITFGDMNDPESRISKLLEVEKEGRAFHMLEEINVRPQISYLTKVRNKDAAAKAPEKKEHA
ncbi:TAT-variant-translocated molybdopterin oxidoreductase [Dyadobacter chenwenxiniae]|uniref:TAT-variant-translocated molybdopterin oxidoreductase n=1 Tax=Dyadobacter chenwenxiniae TaxID=2906456 RepID=A0A9X1TFM4_9BACT|nr:TAT-variant-translocated molybdopterin oxidoreductase [Dyadobacter chenwenxiniae]MCF0064496.1 TAT-variant-translocated molybdopterin oxidoreductase [Dyadobacter chenwenxiniae]UON82301.1 TAT-variant-translocated molybdopterin oxidoreductase [Dyadobacter chenwenxiniae]